MRTQGTIYPSINILPEKAKPVSTFAYENKMAVGHVYTKFKRYESGESKNNPGYVIRCFMGSNFVIPD